MKLLRLFLPLLVLASLARAALPMLVEAEDHALVRVHRLADPDASGSHYVTSDKLWQSLAAVDIPPGPDDEELSIWVRHRGLPIALKTVGEWTVGEKARELGWVHRHSERWEWRRIGVFTRAQLGKRVSFMRGKGDHVKGGLDAIAIGNATYSPLRHESAPATPTAANDAGIENAPIDGVPEPAAEIRIERPVHAKASIDWNRPAGRATRRHYSLNAYRGFTPEFVSNPEYAKNIAYMNPGLLRYHASGMTGNSKGKPGQPTSSWLDHSARAWDVEKIRAAMDAFSPEGVERMICISNFPVWMRTEGTRALDPAHYDDFAKLCADLVRILNVEQKRGIRYFEITNERDFVYWRPQLKAGEPVQVAELAKIYNLAADAMRAVDPTIKLGGPAACRGERGVLEQHREFARLTLRNLDFFSFHCYPTGTAATPDPDVYDGTEEMGEMIRNHVKMLAELSPSRHIELHLNEYNINYRWREGDKRMRNHQGAVFDSLFFVEAVRNGLDVAAAWNECDGTYGKMDSKFRLRPAAHAFHYFNNWLVGQSVKATSDKPKSVVPFAVSSEGGRRGLALINRSGATNTVKLAFTGAAPSGRVSTARISETGLETDSVNAADLRDHITLPPHSVTFYSFNI
jgi:Alpha-L-arabinofuranosidase